MERIRYYPNDGEYIKGKNKIFLAAHPAESTQYLASLWEEVKRVDSNCIFWYDSQPELSWDADLTQSLQQTGVQMFLFPVTAKLLNTENNAVSVLLPYALENHIPIVPILMEPGLTIRYKEVFKNIQYLDKVTVDPTAISYEIKFRRFLRDILISRETAKKIQAAFVAYIFLSYRKMDRVLAARLMKLIHEIPQMRDVAIWYDEFLVPGEDFNDTIAAALKKSALFAMAVTPNLLEEGNYVLSTEYPEAIKAGKTIMAAQIADTDSQLYRRKLAEAASKAAGRAEDVPHAIDAYDADALKTALFGSLKHIALARNNEPRHTFLIGLAYLNGIDVERNYDRAMELITSAAEGGYPEAIEKLADLLMYGAGGSRDDMQSLYWQERLTDIYREKCGTSASVKDRMNYAESLRGVALRKQSLEQIDEAIKYYEEARKEYKFCIGDAEYGEEAQECLLVTENILVTAYLRKSDNNRARKTAHTIIDQLSPCPLEELTITQRSRLAVACCTAAKAEEKLGNISVAADLHRRALSVCENEVGRQHLKRQLAHIYLDIGEQYLKHKDYLTEVDSAEDYLVEAESLFEYLNRESGELVDVLPLCDVYIHLGNLFPRDEFDEFRENYFVHCERKLNAALLLAQALEVSMPWPMVKNRIAASHAGLCNLYYAWGKPEAAKEHAKQLAAMTSGGTALSKTGRHTKKNTKSKRRAGARRKKR